VTEFSSVEFWRERDFDRELDALALLQFLKCRGV